MRRNLILVVLSSFVLVSLLSACGSASASNSTPTAGATQAADDSSVTDADLLKPIDGYMKAAAAGDIEAAWGWQIEEDSKKPVEDVFAGTIKQLRYLYDGYQSITIKEKTALTDTPWKPAFGVTVTAKYADGTEGTIGSIVHQEADGWKIATIDIKVDPSRVKKADQPGSGTTGSTTPTAGGVSTTDLGNGWKRYQVAGTTIDLPSTYIVSPGMGMPNPGKDSGGLLLMGGFQGDKVSGNFMFIQDSSEKSNGNGGGAVHKESIKLPAGDADKWVISETIDGKAWRSVIYEIMRGSEKWSISLDAMSKTDSIDEAKYLAEFDKIAQSLTFTK